MPVGQNTIIITIQNEGLDQFKKDIASIEESLSKLSKNGAKSIDELSKTILSLQKSLNQLKNEGNVNTKELIQLEQQINHLTSTMLELVNIQKSAAEATKQAAEGNRTLISTMEDINTVVSFLTNMYNVGEELIKQTKIKLVLQALETAAQRAYAIAVGQSTGAMRAFRLALASTGVGLAIAGISILISKLIEYSEIQREASNLANEISKNTASNAAHETSQLDILYKSAINTGLAYSEREKAIAELQKLYPEYFGNIEKDKILNGEALSAYKMLNEAILVNSRLKAIKSQLDKNAEKRLNEEIRLIKEVGKAQDQANKNKGKTIQLAGTGTKEFSSLGNKTLSPEQSDEIREERVAAAEKALAEYRKKAEAEDAPLQAEYIKGKNELADLPSLEPKTTNNGNNTEDTEADRRAKREQQDKEASEKKKQLLEEELTMLQNSYNTMGELDNNRFETKRAIILKEAEIDKLGAKNSAEKAAIDIKANKKIADLSKEFNKEFEKITEESMLNTAKLISNPFESQLKQAEISYQSTLASIEEKRINLLKQAADSKSSPEQVKGINDAAMIEEQLALKEHNEKLAQINAEKYAAQIEETNKAFTNEKVITDTNYIESQNKLKQQRLDDLNQKGLTSKQKLEIEKQYNKDREALDREYATQQLQKEKQLADERVSVQQTLINNLEAGGLTNTDAYKTALDKLKEFENAAIESSNKIKENELANEEAKRVESAKTKEDKLKNAEEVLNQTAGFVNQGFGIAKGFIDAEAQELENKKKQGLITEEQYQKELAKIKRKQAIADKAQAIFNASVALSVAIIKALPDPVHVALVAALGALQIAAIIAKPIPKFKQGSKYVERGNNPIGTDTIPAMLNEGEAVIPTHLNKQHTKAVAAILEGNFERKYIDKEKLFSQFAMPNIIGRGNDLLNMNKYTIEVSELKQFNKNINKLININEWQEQYMRYAESQRNETNQLLKKRLSYASNNRT